MSEATTTEARPRGWREQDAEIARRIFGWHDFAVSPFNGAFLGLPPGKSRDRRGSTAYHSEVPRFLADPAAMLELIAALAAQGWSFEIANRHSEPGTILCTLGRGEYHRYEESWDEEYRGEGATLPEAVARAALAATEEPK